MLPEYSNLHPYTIVLVRRAEDDHRPAALVAMLRRLAALDPPVAFTRHRGNDMTWLIEEVSEEWLTRTLLMNVDEPMALLVGRLALMTDHDPPIKLIYSRELRWRPFRYEIITIDVPWAPKRAERPTLQTREQLFTVLREASVAFDAHVGAIYPRSLHALVRLASDDKVRAGKDLPDNGGSVSRRSDPPSFVGALPDGLFERFGGLLPTRRFDVAAVPESVWWGNVWHRDVVERLGRERIEALPWERIEPLGDGGLFLQATRAVPGPRKPAALARVAELIEGLELPARQAEVHG